MHHRLLGSFGAGLYVDGDCPYLPEARCWDSLTADWFMRFVRKGVLPNFSLKKEFRDSISTYFWLFSSDPLVVADLSMVTVYLFQAKKNPIFSLTTVEHQSFFILFRTANKLIIPWSNGNHHVRLKQYDAAMMLLIRARKLWATIEAGQVRDWYQYSCGTLEEHPFTS